MAPQRLQFIIVLLVGLATHVFGCSGLSTRVQKTLVPQDFVFAADTVTSPANIIFKNGYRGELPETYTRVQPVEGIPPSISPPVVTRDGWIEVVPQGVPIRVRLWVRNIGLVEQEFFQIKSLTGNIPYVIPNEIRLTEDITPSSEPVRIWLRNLKNPFNSYQLNDGALILIEVIDPNTDKCWRYLFTYKDFGSRSRLSFNVLLNVPPDLLSSIGGPRIGTDGFGNAAFTASYSIGYRPRTQNPVLRWTGDKVAIVGLLGTSATMDFGARVFDNLSIGTGVELYDFLSLNVLKSTAQGSHSWGFAVGFDAVRATVFTRNLTVRLIRSNQLK